MKLKIVILCGGNGTRLWPISREDYPKQFNRLFDSHSLFQHTILRNTPLLEEFDGYFEVISNEAFFFIIQDQMQEIHQPLSHFILESIPRNTAGAITFSALNSNPDDILLVLPSDHHIQQSHSYLQCIKQAIHKATSSDYLITFGIKPQTPHTGYGYIQTHGEEVKCFIEKPDYKTAKSYLESGDYFWNSGMFCFQAKTFLEELKTYNSEIFETSADALSKAKQQNIRDSIIRLPLDLSQKIPSASIDCALMEKSKKVHCIKANFLWNDIGSFDALSQEFQQKDLSSSPFQNNHVIQKDSKNNFILSEKFTATLGVENLIIVDTPDSLLVMQKGRSQEVKELIPLISQLNPQLTKNHNITYRPWGSYQVLLESSTYKIKKICVKCGCRLSLQKHHHRNEHWIVVSGTANITLEDKTFDLHPNESTYIPMGQTHRLANKGKIDLVLIEIQMGEYLGEDDIIRIEDDFRRC